MAAWPLVSHPPPSCTTRPSDLGGATRPPHATDNREVRRAPPPPFCSAVLLEAPRGGRCRRRAVGWRLSVAPPAPPLLPLPPSLPSLLPRTAAAALAVAAAAAAALLLS